MAYNLDLATLSNEETHIVLGVLKRDKLLKEIEKARIGRIHGNGDRSPLSWQDTLTHQLPIKTERVQSTQSPNCNYAECTDQHAEKLKPTNRRDDKNAGLTFLRARLSSIFSLKGLKNGRDVERTCVQSSNIRVADISKAARLNFGDEQPKQTEDLQIETVHTESLQQILDMQLYQRGQTEKEYSKGFTAENTGGSPETKGLESFCDDQRKLSKIDAVFMVGKPPTSIGQVPDIRNLRKSPLSRKSSSMLRHPDITPPHLFSHQYSSSHIDTVEGFFPGEEKLPAISAIQTTNMNTGVFQKTVNPTLTNYSPKLRIGHQRAKTQRNLSKLKPDGLVTKHSSYSSEAPCGDIPRKPACDKQSFSVSQPSLFPGFHSPYSLDSNHKHSTPVKNMRGLDSSLIYDSYQKRKAVVSPQPVTIVSPSSKHTKQVVLHNTIPAKDAQHLDPNGNESILFCTQSYPTRWMSSSERINILAKEHELVSINSKRSNSLNMQPKVQPNECYKLNACNTMVNQQLNTNILPSPNTRNTAPSPLPVKYHAVSDQTRSSDDPVLVENKKHSNINEHNSKRSETEPIGQKGPGKVDKILSRLRKTFRSKNIEDRSILFGSKGNASDLSIMKLSPKITQLETENGGTANQHNERDIKCGNEDTVMNNNPYAMSSDEVIDKGYQKAPFIKDNTTNEFNTEHVLHRSSGFNNAYDNKIKIASTEIKKTPQHTEFPLTSFTTRYYPVSGTFGLKPGRSVSVSNIYSNRKACSRRISKGSDVSKEGYCKSLEDCRDPRIKDFPISPQTRTFSLFLEQSTESKRKTQKKELFNLEGLEMPGPVRVKKQLAPTNMYYHSSPAHQTTIDVGFLKDQPITKGYNPLLTDFEEYDSDSSTDGEYYLGNDDSEKESVL